MEEENMNAPDMRRITIRLSSQVHEWFRLKSQRTGLSMSSLMYLALEGHIQQQAIVDVLPRMQIQLEELQEFAKVSQSIADGEGKQLPTPNEANP